ncbi:hypothetical protein [Oceanobacillus picturae]|uniref:hypothetical protein n=1 Tax=Oceanobacillus picturae TaxID=171693 RepID=UPI00363159FC
MRHKKIKQEKNRTFNLVIVEKVRILRGRHHTLAKEICGDSSGNSTSPKAPQEAFFASEETKAVPTESEVFSEAVIKQFFLINVRVLKRLGRYVPAFFVISMYQKPTPILLL